MAQQLDKFHFHEVMDRAMIVYELIQNILLDHPVIENDPELKEKVSKAHELIYLVYSEVGVKKSEM